MASPAIRWILRPTPAATPLGLVLLAMWLAAVNYGNNLAYFFLFLVSSTVLVSLLHAVRNVRGLHCLPGLVQSAFAGDPVRLNFQLQNKSNATARAVQFQTNEGEPLELPGDIVEIAADETRLVTVLRATRKRGTEHLGKLRVGASDPLGVFWVGHEYEIELAYSVYPQPQGQAPWPEEVVEGGTETRHGTGGTDFAGYRTFREGESPRRIDWKAVARGRPMMMKDFTGGGGGAPLFDFAMTPGSSVEVRLGQMARWILEAEAREEAYAIKLNGPVVGPGRGARHRHLCLKQLAEYPA